VDTDQYSKALQKATKNVRDSHRRLTEPGPNDFRNPALSSCLLAFCLFGTYSLRNAHDATNFAAKRNGLDADAASWEAAYADAAKSISQLLTQQLWPSEVGSGHLVDNWNEFSNLGPEHPIWGFWIEWYQGIWDGSPMDWELQHKIAIIPDAEWEMGAGNIAKRIEEIRALFELEQQIAKLKEQISDRPILVAPSDRLHNQPPEPVDNAAELKKEVTLLKERIDDLEQETAKVAPSPSKLKELADWFASQLKRLCGFGFDLSGTFLKEGAKKAGALGGAALVAHLSSPEGLPALVQSILKYASTLPPG
jgi:hypothetical protein